MDQGNLGERVREARRARDLSQEALAREAGVSLNQVNKLERGVITDPHYSTLYGLASALEVSVEDLAGREPVPLGEAPEEAGRRADVYEPWAEFVNRFAERWEQKIAGGVLDHGSVMEFTDVLGDLWPVLSRLEREEKQEQPAEYPNTLGPVAGGAMNRLLALLNPLIAAGAKQVEDSDLARLRHRREQMVSEQDCAASG